MKNREKYKEQIIEGIGRKKGDFCNDFIKPIILAKYGEECVFLSCQQCMLLQSIWLDEEYEEPKVDWSKVGVDTPILVSNINIPESEWQKRHFAKYRNGKVYTYRGGCTSWSAMGTEPCDFIDWKYAKLAETPNWSASSKEPYDFMDWEYAKLAEGKEKK